MTHSKDWLSEFLNSKGPASRKVYRSAVKRFLRFLNDRGRRVDEVRKPDLDDYHRHLTAQGVKGLKPHFSMINGFLKYVAERSDDFESPVGRRGDLKQYAAASYAESDEFGGLLAAFGAWIGSDNTRRVYMGSVRRFFEVIRKRPEEIDHGDLIGWRRGLQENGRLKSSTMGLYLSAVSRFARFLAYRGTPTVRPDLLTREALGIPKRQRRRGRPDHLTDEELKGFFGAMRTAARDGSVIADRDGALFGLILAFGLRAGEAAQATGRQFEIGRGGARLVIDGRKHQRELVSTLELTEVRDLKLLYPLRDWMKRAGTGPDDPLICRVRWNPRHRTHDILPRDGLTVRAIEYRFRYWLRKADIGGPGRLLKVHSLRHTRATELARTRRWDIAKVRDFLGHASIAQTDIYLH